VKNGQPGRPKKTVKRGVYVRIKTKGSQAHKKGPKRPKYQSPWPEHPETMRTIEETDIHAHHAEAFFSSLRRKCATRAVPAVALGVIERQLSVREIFHIQMA
jgi:hypothetical protein